MVEPKRLESVPAADPVDRDSQAEALLLDGLDRYFSGRYEDAIHIWTRVLFIDRSHARARAYIDRARSALAERQRHAEELLQASRDLLDQGQTVAARRYLTEAVAAHGEDEHASALRVRLERLERTYAAATAPAPAVTTAEVVPAWSWPRRSRTVLAAAGIFAAMVAVTIVVAPAVQESLGLRPTGEVLSPAAGPVKLPVLSSSEVALVRARTLFDRGRLAEALAALDRVMPDSPVRSAAEALRVEIQQLLLASARAPSGRQAESFRR